LAFVSFKVACKESLSIMMFTKSLLYFCMLSIFYLIAWSSANTLLFSLFLSNNFVLSFCSFSKAPWRFWTNLSFSSIIYLFLISKSKNISKIFVIYRLYFAACLNIVMTFLCSSNSASTLYTNPSVLHLRIWPMEFVFDESRLLCAAHTSPNAFILVA
jgi:hypothetical protein